jgi:hypothetical protein
MELTSNIRLRRFHLVGLVLRMKDERAPKKALEGYTERRWLVGRPRGRWIDAIDRAADWRRLAEDRDARRRWIEEALAHVGL